MDLEVDSSVEVEGLQTATGEHRTETEKCTLTDTFGGIRGGLPVALLQ